MINGVVFNKLQALDRTLVELRSLGEVSPERMRHDWLVWRAIERDIQVLVEIVIDVCQRVLSLAGQTPATNAGEAVERCIYLGALSDNDAYRNMVQFRNFIVHRYDRVDVAILADVVNHRLSDFDQFKHEILAYVQQQDNN